MEADKVYYNQKDNEITATRDATKRKVSRHHRNDVSRLHTVPQSGFEPPTPALGEPCSIP